MNILGHFCKIISGIKKVDNKIFKTSFLNDVSLLSYQCNLANVQYITLKEIYNHPFANIIISFWSACVISYYVVNLTHKIFIWSSIISEHYLLLMGEKDCTIFDKVENFNFKDREITCGENYYFYWMHLAKKWVHV